MAGHIAGRSIPFRSHFSFVKIIFTDKICRPSLPERHERRGLDLAYLRPRFNGYLQFQDQAGAVVHRYLSTGGREKDVVKELNRLLRASRPEKHRGDL